MTIYVNSHETGIVIESLQVNELPLTAYALLSYSLCMILAKQ